MATIVKSIGARGIEGFQVDVEVQILSGVTMMNIVGLGDTAVKEAKDRIESSLNRIDLDFPKKRIVVNLSPSDIKKSGTYFDLPMLIGILLESEQVKLRNFCLGEYAIFGELGLNGELKSFSGVLPLVIAAKTRGFKKVILPREALNEARLVSGIELFGFINIKDLIAFMERRLFYQPPKFIAPPAIGINSNLDFADVCGHKELLNYIVAATAGNHNLLMIGAPGCGKSMIAKRIPTILPSMTEEEMLEVTSLYSISGLLKRNNLINTRPFRAPHYNASLNALIGGGTNATPGEISLAHNGVLFLDEFAEFSRSALEALRQPLEDRKVTISRVRQSNSYPANFLLVAAMNPCKCGNFGNKKCTCSSYDVTRYRQRISGPILDRIDIQKFLGKEEFINNTNVSKNTSSKELRNRVEIARSVQNKRFAGIEGISSNGQMESIHMREFCVLDGECQKLLEQSYKRYDFSARTYHKIIKISRTFADMDQSEHIRRPHMLYSLMSRDMDKESINI